MMTIYGAHRPGRSRQRPLLCGLVTLAGLLAMAVALKWALNLIT